jgi:hypothetical protein
MEERSGGEVYDFSMFENHGVIYGLDEVNDWVEGYDGKGFGVDFDGVDGHIRVNNGAVPKGFSSSYPISMMALCRPDTFSLGGGRALLCYSDFDTLTYWTLLELHPNGTTDKLYGRFVVRSGAAFEPATGVTEVQNMDKAVIIGVGYYATNRKVFVNGYEDGQNTVGITFPANCDKATVGALSRSSDYTNADIADGFIQGVRCWRRDLFDDEILRLSEQPDYEYLNPESNLVVIAAMQAAPPTPRVNPIFFALNNSSIGAR